MPLLTFLFALVALIYASVGFGGGSTYTALLALWGVDFRFIPVIALLCNIIVVTGGCVRFYRAKLIDWRAILPLVAVSAPMAFLGGFIPIEEQLFFTLLGGALLISACALFIRTDKLPLLHISRSSLLILSSAIGLLAGLSGIGGGIFMAPMLHLIRWREARKIAAFASVYILINSTAGLIGQFGKSGLPTISDPIFSYWPLLLAVFAGGQLGSIIGLKLLAPKYLRWLTAILVGYVAIRLLGQTWLAL